jgi:predicted site-specific integrase-resolvase
MTDQAMPAPSGKRYVPRSQKAASLGVNPRTIRRWCDAGILSPPLVINGRTYHDAEETPKTAAARDGVKGA